MSSILESVGEFCRSEHFFLLDTELKDRAELLLAAWCELRQGFRYFRTDRMTFAEALDQRYPESRSFLKDRWRKAMDAERESYFPRA